MRLPLLVALVLDACLWVHEAQAQVDFTDSNLPIVVINTGGPDIEDDPRIIADMGIIWNGDGIRNYLSDPFNDYDGKISIEIRGSTSQQYPKKSYGIETRDEAGNNLNVSLLGLPAENDWILYGAYPDKSLMRNELTYSLFSQMQPWSPRHQYCELVINGEYKGLYSLIEKVKIDSNRLDLAELKDTDLSDDELTGGYVIKVDKLTGSSSFTWTSDYQEKLKFLYHDPPYEELDPIQQDYIREYVSAFEDAVYGPDFDNPYLGYRPFIDVHSFIDFMLMQELGRTVDGYRSSSFMYKDKNSRGGKLACGPMWDFNLSFGNCNYCDSYELEGWQYEFAEVCPDFTTEPPEWWARLLEDPTYTWQLQCRWQNLRETVLSEENIYAWIDSFSLLIEEAQVRNFEQWDILGVYVNWNYIVWDTWEEEVDYLKSWFNERLAYMDAALPGGNCELPYDPKSPPNLSLVNSIESNASSVIAFPNPTSSYLFIQAPVQAVITLKNLKGQSVPLGQLHNAIDMRDLPAGLYVLQVNEDVIQVVKE